MPSISIPASIIGGIGSVVGGAATAIGASGLAGPLIGAAGSIGSSLLSGGGAQGAANTQTAAANQAAATQLQMYNQTRQDLSPFTSTGSSAISQLAGLFGLNGQNGGVPNAAAATSALTQFPGYQFGLSQGQTALDRSAASQGMTLSGAQLKASQQFGQNYGMQQAWNPYVSQLSNLSSIGENAAAQVGNNGLATGQGVAGSQLAAGQATAAGQVAQSNNFAQLLTQGGSQLGAYASNWAPGASYNSPGTALNIAAQSGLT